MAVQGLLADTIVTAQGWVRLGRLALTCPSSFDVFCVGQQIKEQRSVELLLLKVVFFLRLKSVCFVSPTANDNDLFGFDT